LKRIFSLLTLLLGSLAHGAATPFEPTAPTGQTLIHDPSTIIQDGGRYYIFGTKPGINARSSTDLLNWVAEPNVFKTPPAWTKKIAPGFDGYFWAPDIIKVNGKFLLYYSVSAWGKQTSAIGLVTSPTLDATATNHVWTDCGEVIHSTNGYAFNTIDPSVMQDRDGKLWLAFGSYWQGLYLTELNPQTGKRVSTNSPLYQLAWNHSIEAACLTRHGKFYYLFVNWGQCCKGTNSTYEVRVGRAENVTGPYLDRDGKDLKDGGGSPFLQSHGRFFGPGHIGILGGDGDAQPTRFSFHYYDADTAGKSRFALGTLDWSDGWPVAVTEAANETWKLVWADEFNTNGAPDPANWNYEHGFERNHEAQWYQPENAICTNGLLVITARRETKPNPHYVADSNDWRKERANIHYTSASLTTRHLREFKYGKFEMRARIDTRSGSWPAFWTLGAERGHTHWPAGGEVDIMEFYTGTVLANFGYQLDHQIKWLAAKKPIADFNDPAWTEKFHTWTMLWDEQKMDLLLDGQLLNHLDLADADHADGGNPFHRSVYLLLNQAIGGDSGGDPTPTTFPVKFEVDWVRVYQH
jgi:beta-glucanase (GH16 family)